MNGGRVKAYTPREVAEIINADMYTVRELLREGRLRGFKLNTHWRITPEALDEFMSKERADEGHSDEASDV